MKKLFFLALLFTGISFGQYHQDGWGVGVGLNSVRFMSDVVAEPLTFGGQIQIQRDFDQFSGFRISLDYNHFYGIDRESLIPGTVIQSRTNDAITTDQLNFSAAFIYRFFVERPIVPFVGVGFSTMQYTTKNSTYNTERSSFGELGADLYFGALFNFEWLPENWLFKAELSQHTVSTDQFDFVSRGNGGGFFGGSIDSYIGFHVGAMYFWDATPAPKAVDLMPSGLSAKDLQKLEALTKQCCDKDYEAQIKALDDKLNKVLNELENLKNKPAAPASPVIINQEKPSAEKPVLLKPVYFKVGTVELEPESFDVLISNYMILSAYPAMSISLEGHTDNTGDVKANQKLSDKRSSFIKGFLVKRGIDASRILTSGYGEKIAVMDNTTDTGRRLNRRVEFKIK